MECYYHPGTQAVAICSGCNRGICDASSAEVEYVLACRDSCEPIVKGYVALRAASLAALRANRGLVALFFWPAFYFGVGVILIGAGVRGGTGFSQAFLVIGGSILAAFGFMALVLNLGARANRRAVAR